MTSPRYSAAIVHHDSAADLRKCLASLLQQSAPPREIWVVDHGVQPEAISLVAKDFPSVQFWKTANEGYAGGANRLLEKVRETNDRYALIVTPDVVLDSNFSERLIESVDARPRVAIASGKLLRPDRKKIDSAGIEMRRDRRPRDRGSEEPDRGQFDHTEVVFAVCGAVMLVRMSALPALSIDGELFDRDFFCYYEDTDLCWRAHKLGLTVLYEPNAVAIHRRGWRKSERFNISTAMRRHSFKNRYLQIVKNERAIDFIVNLPTLLVWEVLRLAFATLRDRELLLAYPAALRLIPRMLQKRRLLQRMSVPGTALPSRHRPSKRGLRKADR